ncbi:MAG: transposase [Bacilli bacterium]|nr:transposase [Bacilli bacterium]
MSIKAIKYELKMNATQTHKLRCAVGCVRFVHNYMLDIQQKHYEENKKWIPYPTLSKKYLTPLKQQHDWLREPSKWCLQVACKNLCENLFSFKKLGRSFPKFKRKGRCVESIHITENPQLNYEDWTCKIAKIGKVKVYRGHNKRIPKDAKVYHYSVEYKPSLDRCFLSVVYEDNSLTNKRIPNKDTHCGIDVGIKTFATLSDGKVFENQKHLKSNLKKLRVLQRSASRKYKKGVKTEEQSSNWKKVQRKIAKLHFHIANQRQDYNHKVSKYLSENYYLVSVEDLAVKNMVKNHRLAQAVSDVAWSSFLSMLKYKCQAYQEVDRFFASSQTCGYCGYKNLKVKDLSVRSWVCPQCGVKHDRDLNASKNIDREGLSLWRRKVSQ